MFSLRLSPSISFSYLLLPSLAVYLLPAPYLTTFSWLLSRCCRTTRAALWWRTRRSSPSPMTRGTGDTGADQERDLQIVDPLPLPWPADGLPLPLLSLWRGPMSKWVLDALMALLQLRHRLLLQLSPLFSPSLTPDLAPALTFSHYILSSPSHHLLITVSLSPSRARFPASPSPSHPKLWPYS